MIDEAESLLQRASADGATGRWQLEAAVQSAHAVRRHGHAVPWRAVVMLYDRLRELTASPVCELNRCVALAEAEGPAAGLAALRAIEGDERLQDYQPFWAARAELMARAGSREEALAAYQRAIGLETDAAVRHFLQGREALVRAT
jgi:RNA polymerase sigma-70 factor, ECF subfamily